MPVRSASLNDEVYKDIHQEMEKSNNTFSQVLNRRLNKLMEIEKVNQECQPISQ
jgi:predicted CopG family antitoxin